MQQVFGAILMAVGVLIAGTSGLCSVLVLASPGSLSGPEVVESLTIVALMGGIPFGVGVGLAYLGYRLVRPGRTD